MTRVVVDGAPAEKPAPMRIELLDSIGFERRMSPQPLTKELDSFDAFIQAGGWLPTVPSRLE
jgi:hypothetical protein